MKPSTEYSYQQRIERVIGFLNDQVENNPSLETLAKIAAISPFHFHRVYRAATGETPSATLRRLKLAKACCLLRDTSKPITHVAFDVGYDSSQSFAKAFRQATGFSPTEIRKNRRALDNALSVLSSPGNAAKDELANIAVEVVSVDPFKVIASRHVGRHEGLFRAFGELFAWAEQGGLTQRVDGIYGIPVDDPRAVPEEDCRFDCCIRFGPGVLADGAFREQELGGGDFAVARHTGPYEGLEDIYDYVYGPWLNTSGFFLREQAPFNHYLQDPDTVPPEEWQTDIYIPVETAA